MDVLLNINIVLDLCTPRVQWYKQSRDAVDMCTRNGGRIWLYAGSVQTLIYNLFHEIRRLDPELSFRRAMTTSLDRLKTLSEDVQAKVVAAIASQLC